MGRLGWVLLGAFLVGAPPAFAAKADPNCLWIFRQISDEKFWDKVYELTDQERLVEMNMFDSIRIESPQACRTGGLGPCVGIAVVNGKTGTAYVAHLPGDLASQKQYQALFEQALKEASSPSDLQVVLAGVAIPRRVPPEVRKEEVVASMTAFAGELREYVKASGIPASQVTDRMRVVPEDRTYELVVDTKEKKIYLTSVRD